MASRNPDSVKQTIAATNHFYSINLRYTYKKFLLYVIEKFCSFVSQSKLKQVKLGFTKACLR